MSSRYQLPHPKCDHVRRGIVVSGDPKAKGAYAATNVCDRPACIADAIEWAVATTRLPAEHIPDKVRN